MTTQKNPGRTSGLEGLRFAQRKAQEAAKRAERRLAETPRQLFLPGFEAGAFPNHLNRSSFICPIAKGKRKHHQQSEMVTRSDCVLQYTGQQLDEADGDLNAI